MLVQPNGHVCSSSCWPTHRPIWGADIAPDTRPISAPPLNSSIVGIPRMPSRPAIACSTSELSLIKRARGSIAAAAFSNSGAIARQGPHHGAQTSTTTGTVLLATCRSKISPTTSAGFPENRGCPQLPHLAVTASRSVGSRLMAPQAVQTTRCSVFIFSTSWLAMKMRRPGWGRNRSRAM
jgi:hypothetical protein